MTALLLPARQVLQRLPKFSATGTHLQRLKLHLHTITRQKQFLSTLAYRQGAATSHILGQRRNNRVSCLSSLCEILVSANMSHSSSNGQAKEGSTKQAMTAARNIFDHAVTSVLPHQMIQKNLQYDANTSTLKVGSNSYILQHNVHVVGFGKAVLGMVRALEECIPGHVLGGVLSIPVGSQDSLEKAGLGQMLLLPSSNIRIMEGAADNLPDEAAHKAAMEITRVVEAVGEQDILVVLISGGGSALLPAPCPPLTLLDMLEVTRLLSRSGVNILDLNMVRKQLDLLKGGGIAKLAHPAKVIALVLSDIIGDDLSFIASGPTVLNTSTPQDCLNLFARYCVEDQVPTSVMSYLKSKGTRSFQSSSEKDFSHVQNVLIGTNKIACEAASLKATALGFLPYVLSTGLAGEARSVGMMFAVLAKYIVELVIAHQKSENDTSCPERNDASSSPNLAFDRLVSEFSLSEATLTEVGALVRQAVKSESAQGVCIITGGETTVTVKGKGRGGRNQEMAVAAGLELHSLFRASGGQVSQEPENADNSSSPGQASSSGKVENVNFSEVKSRGAPAQKVAFLSGGTDGQDGPTPAAGGVVDLDFVRHLEGAGLVGQNYLDNNDSFTLLSNLHGGAHLVVTGLTGTNVMDLQMLIVQFNNVNA